MITLNEIELQHCQEIYNNADSIFDAMYDIYNYLGIDPQTYPAKDLADLKHLITSFCAEDTRTEAPKPHNVARMYELAAQLASTYERKNHDYGNSFHTSVTKYGIIAALTRMSDKWNRLENLILNKDAKVKDEAITDTLIDLATYALMTAMELE